MNEREAIGALWASGKRSPRQRNGLHESDAEILEFGDRLMALTVDDFSAEDGFPASDLRCLGWNLVGATLSDLVAVGAQPLWLAQSVVVARDTEGAFLEGLSAGVQEALAAFGASLAGGDVGRGETFRYTGVGIGGFPLDAEPMSRIIARSAGIIGVTGAFGDGNAAALARGGTLELECRLPEAIRLRASGASCMDTSDGLINALDTIRRLNPWHRLVVDLDEVPYAASALADAAAMAIPREAFLIGSAGEYELLYFAGEPVLGPGFHTIGRFETDGTPGLFLSREGREIPMSGEGLPDPRDFVERETYIRHVLSLASKLFESPV